ncbi:MAG: sigma-70 family RNA polymerase sigma factor [Candidatus Methylomirabilales bacterium]
MRIDQGVEDIAALWRGYRETQDPCLKEALIKRYIHLVRHVAGRMRPCLPSHLSKDELEGAGIMGLLLAVEGFDPDFGVGFSTYAQPRIKGAILDELRKLDPLPRSMRQKTKEIERALAVLEQRFGRQPEDEEVAAHLGVSLDTYYEKLGDGNGFGLLSLDEPRNAWGEDEREFVANPMANPSTDGLPRELLARERQDLLGRLVDSLPPEEKTVIGLYYQEGLTMREVGAVLEVSESRVSQLHSSAILRLRARLRNQGIGSQDLMG